MFTCLFTRTLLITALSLSMFHLAWAEQAAAPSEQIPAGSTSASGDVWYKTEAVVSGPPAPSSEDYPRLNLPGPLGESRLIIWILAQAHVYWGGFILGILLLTTYFEIKGFVLQDARYVNLFHKIIRPILFVLSIIAILGGIFPLSPRSFLSGIVSSIVFLTIYWETKGLVAHNTRYDKLAYDMLRLILLSFWVTAILGGVLLVSLFYLYPNLTKYLMDVFRPVFLLYGLLALLLTASVYVYYYTWNQMTAGNSKWAHVSIGILVNVIGTTMMLAANAWSSFMMAPAGVDSFGHFLGNYWHVIYTPLWSPSNALRLVGNLVFGGSVLAAYAAYRVFTAKSNEERAHFDWMGYTAMFNSMFLLLLFPFAIYALLQATYSYQQQMGMTLMGGILAWLFIIQFIMIGSLLILNYYLWQGLERMPGAGCYQKYTKYLKVAMIACFVVWIWLHALMPANIQAPGESEQTILGNYASVAAKNSAINIILTTTILSFILYRRGNKLPTVKWAPLGNAMLFGLFTMAYLNIIWLSVYGYFIPANVRVGLSVPQVASTLSCLGIGVTLNRIMLIGAKETGAIAWGQISIRSKYVLIVGATFFTWLMGFLFGLIGYIRSSVRLSWHVNGIMRDNSPWAFTNTMGFAAKIIILNTLIFWVGLLFVTLLARLVQQPISRIPDPAAVDIQKEKSF